MRAWNASLLLLASGLIAAGCTRPIVVSGTGRPTDVVVVGAERGKAGKKGGKKGGPRGLKVPPGHYPPAGHCRLWYPGRPPGQQPAPVRCSEIRGRIRGTGAFILYNGSAWDADYDWHDHERRNPRSVPTIIIEVTRG